MMLNDLKRSNIAQHFTNSTAKREQSTIKMTVCGRRRVTSAWDSRSRWSLIDLILEDASDEWHTLTHMRCTTLLMHICTYCSFVQQLMEGLRDTSQTSFLMFYQQNTSLSFHRPQSNMITQTKNYTSAWISTNRHSWQHRMTNVWPKCIQIHCALTTLLV